MTLLKYRSDIDGLRAVAVLGVVIYHAFPWVIPGGFIGVDIFFVISGYLISGILYKGHNAGNFSFKEFYARRIRRLFPALITVLVITMAYGWVILLPDEFEQLGKHVAAGTLFIQNIVFWQESGYFDTSASLKPLLHLWSLAVEEQFYIFFPPILLLIWKRKWPIASIMLVLLVISLGCNLWMSVHAGTADFFLTPYRAWEFLGGSLLAWWHKERVKKLGGVARGQGILDGKAPASENPPAGFDRAGNTARRGPLSSPEGLGG
ncbi:MAG: acyltransferase, partial [Verrucomicrobia bacterium]|nr:acyltransferase [Verrucomicrobiota bacterium]